MSAFLEVLDDHNRASFLFPGDLIGRGDRTALRIADPAVSEFAAGVSLREVDGVPTFFVLGLRTALTTDRHGVVRDLAVGDAPDALHLHERFSVGKERLRVAQVHIPARRPVLLLSGREVLLPMADTGLNLMAPWLRPPGEGLARVRFDRVGWTLEEGGLRTASLTDGVDEVTIGGVAVGVRWRDVAGAASTALVSHPVRVAVHPNRVEVTQGGAVCVWDCTASERELFEAAAGLLRKRVSVPAEDLYKRLHPDVRNVSNSMIGGMQRGTWHRAMAGFPFRPPLEWAQREIRVARGVVLV